MHIQSRIRYNNKGPRFPLATEHGWSRKEPISQKNLWQAKQLSKEVRESTAKFNSSARECVKRLSRNTSIVVRQREQVMRRINRLISESRKLGRINRYFFLRTAVDFMRVMGSEEMGSRRFLRNAASLDSLFNLLKPKGKYPEISLRYKPLYWFEGGYSKGPFLSVKVHGKEVGFLDINLDHDANLEIRTMQSTADSREATEALGKRWYEALTEKIILCAEPMYLNGGTVVLNEPPQPGKGMQTTNSDRQAKFAEKTDIYKWLRDRYFTKRPFVSWLNPRRKRVREILGDLVREVPIPETMPKESRSEF